MLSGRAVIGAIVVLVSAAGSAHADPLDVFRRSDGARPRVASLVAPGIGGTLALAFGLGDRYQVGLSIPLLSGPTDAMTSSRPIDGLRIAGKVQLLHRGSRGVDGALTLGPTLPVRGATDVMPPSRPLPILAAATSR
jgi:hypothetical protein